MIDQIISRISKHNNHYSVDPNYKPEEAIKNKRFTHVPGLDELVIIFPYWHANDNIILKALAIKLNKNGMSTLSYVLHDDFMQKDLRMVDQSYIYLQKTISEEIEKLKKYYKFRKVTLIGMSIGKHLTESCSETTSL